MPMTRGYPRPQSHATKVYLETLGCAKNRVDSEIMLSNLARQGYDFTRKAEEAEVIIVNTCGFITEASQESIDRILQLSDYKEQGNCRKLIAAGCVSQRYGSELRKEIPELDGVLGSNGFERIPELIQSINPAKNLFPEFLDVKPHYRQYENQERLQSTPAHYAYLKIAEGCSNMCSFCNIPLLRGNFSSRTITSIETEVREMVSRGVKEINLLSQDTSSYGVDLRDGTNLAGLLKVLSSIQGDFWLRMFYCYPNSFSKEVLEVMASDRRMCRYLDMPFQHIHDSVLRDMNRKITAREIDSIIRLVSDYLPDAAWRTTLMVGFPTETQAHFEELANFVSAGYFQHLGVFCYSHEENIRSSKWGDAVPAEVKNERRSRLMEIQQRISLERNRSVIGETLKVLVDGPSEETELLLEGRTEFQGPEVDGVVYIRLCSP